MCISEKKKIRNVRDKQDKDNCNNYLFFNSVTETEKKNRIARKK